MKKIFTAALMLLFSQALFAQSKGIRPLSDLPCIAVSPGSSLHFRSPEPISYSDISDQRISGDLPLKNVLRIKIPSDSALKISQGDPLGTITIVGETFMAQYRLERSSLAVPAPATEIEILPGAMLPLDPQRKRISTPAIKSHALDMLLERGKRPLRKKTMQGISISLKGVYSVGELIFLDLCFENSSQLIYDAGELRFSLEDKKINRATNSQSIALSPVFSLYPLRSFSRISRNIYVIEKVAFSHEKRLEITMSEKQLSSRTVTLPIKYGDLLGADTF
ncbi:DUF4138 domain-containing protein [Pedobacter psychrodurus]|uniref:DUF4138 domain-containing protein n=1 Tax=Pedobacter psychrodurus TaxID=2530456 RepID=UPI002930699E|nr:DUF4138 domain-containing protein [Pedobacter psychrodurus]